MNINWSWHAKYYDLFQNNRDDYAASVKWHLKQLDTCKLVLDAGAGTGNLTFEMLKDGKEVFAIDLNETFLYILKNKCSSLSPLKTATMDADNLSFNDASFDGVASMFVVPFTKDYRKHITELFRVLKPGGILSFSAWTPIEDSWEYMFEGLRKELTDKGILPKYTEEFKHIEKSSKQTYKQVLSGPDTLQQISAMKTAGFAKVIHDRDTPYGKYASFIRASKN